MGKIRKYVKKPVTVEVMEWDGSFDCLKAVTEFIGYIPMIKREDKTDNLFLEIRTLEGPMIASPGDMIIKGIKGEFYPCKPDIFEKSYEEVMEG